MGCRHDFYCVKGAYHLSELPGKTSLVVKRIPLLIRTIWPDKSISK